MDLMPVAARAILERLADGRPRSGMTLAAELGVGRAAVWKHIQWLRRAGLSIDADRRRGYRIVGGFEALAAASIEEGLRAAGRDALLGDMAIIGCVDSTQRVVREWAERGSARGSVCWAEAQSAGRGRLGRQWNAPLGAGLWLSLLWRYRAPPGGLGGVSLATAVAVVEALESLGARELQIKWPNDIQWRGRKLGGVLLELVGDPGGDCALIVGVGVNFRLPAETRIDQDWCDLSKILAAPPSRNAVAVALLAHLLTMAESYERGGFEDWRRRWRRLDAVRGRRVILRGAGVQRHGRACGVDADGALRLRTPSGLERFNGGELSLRIGE